MRILINTHFETWNESDLKKREDLMKKVYADDIEMIDRHDILNGYKEISGFVDVLQARDLRSKFTHPKPAEIHHNIARQFWQNGTPEKPDAVTGMDLFVFENGKVKKLYVFVDDKK